MIPGLHVLPYSVGFSWAPKQGTAGGYDAAALRGAGVDCVELSLALFRSPEDAGDPGLLRFYKGVLEDMKRAGLALWSVHLPYGRSWDISDSREAVREKAAAAAARLLKDFLGFGASFAVIHPSFEPVPPEERSRRLELCRDSLRALSASSGIPLAAECLPRTCLGRDSEEIAFLVGDDQRLSVCCDVNHLLRETPQAFIRRLGSRIATVHLSDNDGVDERHLRPGLGTINWPACLEALASAGYRGPLLFEVADGNPIELVRCGREFFEHIAKYKEESLRESNA